MNDSQAALVQKFASEPLEQSEAWVCCCFFSSALLMIIMLSIQITWYPGLEETAELMRNLRDYGLFRQDAIHLVYHVKTEIIS